MGASWLVVVEEAVPSWPRHRPYRRAARSNRLEMVCTPCSTNAWQSRIGATILAAERGAPKDLDLLDEAIEWMEAAKTFEDYRRAGVRFHIGIAETAHSPRLVAAMTEVHGDMSDVMAGLAHPTERLTRSNGHHQTLVTLLRQGDVAHASLLMREHIGETEHRLM